jgi:hypothetical protein
MRNFEFSSAADGGTARMRARRAAGQKLGLTMAHPISGRVKDEIEAIKSCKINNLQKTNVHTRPLRKAQGTFPPGVSCPPRPAAPPGHRPSSGRRKTAVVAHAQPP